MMDDLVIPIRKVEPRSRATMFSRSIHIFALGMVMAWLGVLSMLAPEVADKLP
jgi:hypothetical protein